MLIEIMLQVRRSTVPVQPGLQFKRKEMAKRGKYCTNQKQVFRNINHLFSH